MHTVENLDKIQKNIENIYLIISSPRGNHYYPFGIFHFVPVLI